MFGLKKIAMIVAELVGVFVLTMVFYSMLARTTFPLFSGLAAGLTVGVMLFAVGGVMSEAHLNPALTISMWVMRRLDTLTALVHIAAQVLGAVAAWGLMRYFLGHNLSNLAGTKFEWRVMIAEGVGTAVFAFGVAAAWVQTLDVAKRVFVIGASYALGIMVASLAANGILNPAVALGIHSWDWSYAVGPIFGAVVGSNLYALLFAASTRPAVARVTTTVRTTSPAKKAARRRR